MYLAITNTRSTIGINAQHVSVEVHLSNGSPNFTIVGLAETAVKESKDRVRSAILTSNFEFPGRRITVNLGPADLPKSGSGFDLPIAIGILAASGQISKDKLSSHEFIAELALDGKLRGISGIVPVVLATYRANQTLIISDVNQEEAAIVNRGQVLYANSLIEVCNYLSDGGSLNPVPKRDEIAEFETHVDWSDVKGQYHAKHAMEIAAYGGHSILLSGAPGSGKTMLASRFRTLLPPLNEEQALEYAAILSIKGKITDFSNWRQAPFRSPHHTSSPAALVGGGNPPKPGEISLAHHGVLFLDELPEFNRQVLETLREPIESGHICISRASNQIQFPANFQFLAAMNPCPCGDFGNPQGNCVCTPERINRYLNKLSAPLLDRIDMHIRVQPVERQQLLLSSTKETKQSAIIRAKAEKIQQLQYDRQGYLNARLSVKDCEKYIVLHEQEQDFLNTAMTNLKLSARAFHRLLKVARTIADVQGKEHVEVSHLQQVLSFRHTIKKM